LASDPATAPIRRVRKAYEQVADQLRELIGEGVLPPGARLPSEQLLARDFGVSRATVREALRVLAAENLVRTMKGGIAGGTYVSRPTVDHISEFLAASMNLLSMSNEVSLDDFLEARECLEVPAARLASLRGTDAELERLGAVIPDHPDRMSTQEQFRHNKDFHSIVVEVSGNALLLIAAQPVFSVLQTHLIRSTLGQRVHDRINEDHRAIASAIMARDPDRAEEEMRKHLSFLRPEYERAWRHALHRPESR
jgi:DNA-binding FadR family transcriptional regulator